MSDFELIIGDVPRAVVRITREGNVFIDPEADEAELRVALSSLAKTYWDTKLARTPDAFGPTPDGE